MNTPQQATSLSAEDRVSLIASLALPDSLATANALETTRGDHRTDLSKDSAVLDEGSIIAFTANVSADHAEAALNTALLAQLNSDKLYNRFDPNQIMAWYRNYQKVLGICGWTMQDFQFQDYKASGSSFTIDKAIADLVASFLPAQQVKVVKAALDALKNLSSDDPWYKVWDSSTHNASGGNFQIAMASDDDGAPNSLVLKVSAYSFQTSQTTTRFLWTTYNASDTTLNYAMQAMTLNEKIYDQVAETIAKKIGKAAKEKIHELDI
jgi:hypothetical protein